MDQIKEYHDKIDMLNNEINELTYIIIEHKYKIKKFKKKNRCMCLFNKRKYYQKIKNYKYIIEQTQKEKQHLQTKYHEYIKQIEKLKRI